MSEYIDIPVVATVASLNDDIKGKIKAGARILNVAGGKRTAEFLIEIRKMLGEEFPIIATGGHKPENVLKTIEAGANCISYTPKTSPELLEEIMEKYRSK